MARCPYLEFIGSTSPFSLSSDNYLCKLSGQTMDFYSEKVKYTCNREYGEEYYNCPVYKNR